MKKIEYDGLYASKWGVSDFYEDVEGLLRSAIASGEAFEAPYLDCNKEIVSCSITRPEDNGEIVISVHQSMDEGYDLIYDAIPNGVTLTNEQIEFIYESLFGMDSGFFETETVEEDTLPANSTYEEICSALNSLWDITDERLMIHFDRVKANVQFAIDHPEYVSEYMRGEA